MSKIDELRATFFQESEDLLEGLADGLTEMASGPVDQETVNSVFRAVHSIKGGAGAFALDAVVRFAHRYENVLDALRNATLDPTPEVLDVLTRAADHLAGLVEAARDEAEADTATSDDLIGELNALSGAEDSAAAEPGADFVPQAIALGDLGPAPSENRYRIRFAPNADLFKSGNEAFLLLRELCALGDASVRCDMSALPGFDALDPAGSYLRWDVTLITEASELDVREVFDFVDGLCDLTVETLTPESVALPDLPQLPELPPLSDPTTAVAPEAAAAPAPDAAAAGDPGTPVAPAPAADAADLDGDPAETVGPASDDTPPAAGKPTAQAQPAAAPTQQNATQPVASTIRVELHRIDRMINLVGELVINQAMLTQCIKRAEVQQGGDIEVGLDELRTLTRQIQDSVMAIRAQPVKALFQRMSRIAREAGSDVGKTLRVVTEGAATEIDKTVIERLADPLTHMIRNAVDHGLETAEERRAAGKPPTGEIRLSAAHLSGRVVIEISDDGAGINRDRVRRIAEEKGLVAPDAQLTPQEIDNLIFMPGFSTASTLSNLSGRGVGMDVVKRSIQSLGGRVSISSQAGTGSTFSIVLPLTLAVLDGMVIEVAEQTVVVPISAVVETMRLDSASIFKLGTENSVIRIRGAYVPVVDVGAVLDYRKAVNDPENCVFLLVETADGARAALLIDQIHDQRQVVIKGLEENYGHVEGVAAATILGDGRIALILDPSAIVGAAGVDTVTSMTVAAE